MPIPPPHSYVSLLSPTCACILAVAATLHGAETVAPTAGTAVMLSNQEFRLPPNSRWREERIMSAPKLKLSVELGAEKSVKGTMSMLSRQLVDIEVVSDSSVRLDFIQCESSNDIDFGAEKSRHTNDLPLDGKQVLATRTDKGRWIATLDSRRRPTPEEGSALYALSYLWSEGIYPDEEVGIGKTWKVDASEFRNLFGADFESPKGEFEFMLSRMVDHEGVSCAKIMGKGKLISRTRNFGGSSAEETPLTAEMDLAIEIFRSVELAMDLTVNMKGTMTLGNDADKDALRYKATSPVEFTRTFRKK